MLLEACVDTGTPAVHAWHTLFVFGENSVQRVDTPGQPTKEDEAKARKRARQTAWRLANPTYHKEYRATDETKARKRAYNKAWAIANPVRVRATRNKSRNKNPMSDEAKARKRAYKKEYYAANADLIHAQQKEHKRKTRGCVNCKEWPVGDWRVGIPHYDGHCCRCFSEKFPTHEKVQRKARVELRVRAFLDRTSPNFVHDQTMHTRHCDCTVRRRVDHRRQVGNTLLCVETDEMHHRYYDKDDEQARYHDLMMGWGGKLVFIRFNPDEDNLGPELEERLERLRAEIARHLGRIEREENTEPLEKYYLYYPETPDQNLPKKIPD
jgi:hypothetical protein